MKNRILIIFLIVLVLFSLGCKKSPGIDVSNIIEYHKGTQGLEMNFVKSLPPEEIFEGNDFVIGLELKNKGASDIEQGRLLVYGFEVGYFTLMPDKIEFDVEGKKPGLTEGGYSIANFQAKSVGMPEIVKTYSAPFTVRAFYRYATEAGAEVCINPNIYSYIENANAVCTPAAVKLSGGQGAPVAITKIEQTTSPSGTDFKVNFIVYFKNAGKGEVFGAVYVDEVLLGDETLECAPSSVALKGTEEKSIICSTMTSLSKGAYLAPILVRLEYDYTSSLSKTIKVKSLEQTG